MRTALAAGDKHKKATKQSAAVSDISSLDGDDMCVDLLDPESRKFANDKEYLKFVSI